jgi:hypothetical protein
MKKKPAGSKPIAVVHGECFLYKTTLPENAVKGEIKNGRIILANSEVTGNHHVIDCPEVDGINVNGVELFFVEDTKFIKNSKPVDVKCVIADRHSNITLEPGVWELGIAQEYDYFAQAKRNVAD